MSLSIAAFLLAADCALAGSGRAAAIPQQTARAPLRPVPSARAKDPDQPIARFAGLSRVFRHLAGGAAGDAPARLFDFEQVLAAVTGRSPSAAHSLDEYRRAFDGGAVLLVPADAEARRRDDAAYELESLGYSAREIADILTGRITKAALDNAQKMLMLGAAREQVSDYLDREYRRLAEWRRRAGRPRGSGGRGPAGLEALVAKYAAQHGVEPALARAVAATESGWDQGARSPVGARGVMQLMPGTARELGVDPDRPEQNIEGGIRYLAWLLRSFGSIEAALIAYNAGPGFAQRFARGEVALYGETREFVRRVMGRMQARM